MPLIDTEVEAANVFSRSTQIATELTEDKRSHGVYKKSILIFVPTYPEAIRCLVEEYRSRSCSRRTRLESILSRPYV
jgi:hypothetical protein